MAVSLTSLNTISPCDVVTGWTSGAANADIVREGAASLGAKVSATTSAIIKYDQGGASGVDMTGQHFWVWMLSLSLVDTIANGGLRIYVEDINTNYKTFFVGGSENYSGGWQRFVAYEGATADVSVGTYNPAVHRYVGVQFKTTGKSNANNCFWDYVQYGNGITITSGATDQVTWDNIYTADDTAAIGAVTRSRGIYFLQGNLNFGSSTAGQNIDFKDTNSIALWLSNNKASSDFYKIYIDGNSTGTTSFVLGSKSGTAGIQGNVIKSGGTIKYSIDAVTNASQIDKFQLYGSTFLSAGTISLPPNATNREVLNCNFDACSEVLADTCIVQNCNFTTAAGRAIRMASASHNITDSNFINCNTGVHIPSAGEYTFNTLKFSGNTYDVENSSNDGTVIVNATDGANPVISTNTGTPAGTTTINNTVTLEVNGIKTGSEPANYVRCRIEAAAGGSLPLGTTIMNEEANIGPDANGNYKATEQINYAGEQPVKIRARYKGYLPFETTGNITSSGLTVTAIWQADPNYTA